MVSIYTLALDDNKYFIGRTTNTEICPDDEESVQNVQWLSTYKPIQVIEFIHDCDDFDEDKYVLKYMDRYGIDNVRGGSFYEMDICPEVYVMIENMICTAKRQCFSCGRNGHLIHQCHNYDIKEMEKIWDCFKNKCFECYGHGDVHSIQECPKNRLEETSFEESVVDFHHDHENLNTQPGMVATLYEKIKKKLAGYVR
jgi:hypothetical protein